MRRGQFNFDRITYLIYKDNVAAFEAFKAGEFDFIQAFIAKDWARQYRGGKFASGELVKREWQHGNAGRLPGLHLQYPPAEIRRSARASGASVWPWILSG